MPRVAVFVDAGYLYAAGSTAIHGSRLPQEMVALNPSKTVDKLTALASERTGGVPLLRVYWYDGAFPRGLSSEQKSLADLDNVKLRLGVVTSGGRQKGVDSLIITDLVELARNRAVLDAVLVSGDEDVRIGVQIAQSFGVRVHLVGVEPRNRGNQSRSLRQEADTNLEWSASDVGDVLTVKTNYSVAAPSQAASGDALGIAPETAAALDEAASNLADALAPDEIRSMSNLAANEMIPSEYDSRLLGAGSSRKGSRLDENERIYVRNRFKAAARAAASPPDSADA